MLNLLVATGRLTKEPELRKNGENIDYVNFAVAIDSPSKNEDGERGTTFLECIAFRGLATSIANALHKGSKVALSGALNQRDFIRKDGSKGRVYEIFVDTCEFLDPKPQDPVEPDVSDIPLEDAPQAPQAPQFDPYTGKPLKTKAKK